MVAFLDTRICVVASPTPLNLIDGYVERRPATGLLSLRHSSREPMSTTKRMMTVVIAASLTATVVGLSGCSGTTTSSAPAATVAPTTATAAAPAVPDLTGDWAESDTSGTYQAATIAGAVITINWVSDGGKTESIYWVGSFTQPAADGDTWTSTRDHAATDNALLASSDETKVFTYSNETISYKVSALGTTRTVELKPAAK